MRVEELCKSEFVKCVHKNLKNSFSSFDRTKETFRFSTKRRYEVYSALNRNLHLLQYMSNPYSLEKYVYLRNKLLHKQSKHQSNTLMLLLNYKPIFESFLDFYQTLYHNLIFGVYPYLLVLLRKFCFLAIKTPGIAGGKSLSVIRKKNLLLM